MKSKFDTFVTGFFFGTATGMAVALLSAARSGRETREQLREGFVEVRSRAEGALTDVQSRTQEKVDGVKNFAKEITGEVKARSEKLLNS
jgi:gas vesicle protein